MASPGSGGIIRFGGFELDVQTRELRRNGIAIKAPDKSIQLLQKLLDNAGRLVTRDELHGTLWPEGTTVEFDAGLNSAMKRLREALGDSASEPRFIETLPRKGYRFVGAVELLDLPGTSRLEGPAANQRAAPDPDRAAGDHSGAVQTSDVRADRRTRQRRMLLLACATVAVIAALSYVLYRHDRSATPSPIVLTALDNRTDESVLDEVVPYPLERSLSNGGLTFISRARVEDTLKLMRRDVNTRLTEALAREVSLRGPGIQTVLTTKAERVGSNILLTATLLNPSDGRALEAAVERTPSLEGVAGAIDRLTASLNHHIAGNRFGGGGARSVERVSTPSLKACQLFSEAYRASMRGDWHNEEDLTRGALAEDADFAMAHLWLAYTLKNQLREGDEMTFHLRRAVELSGTASDRERQFILASKHMIEGDDEGAVPLYRVLLSAYADDYFARTNLAAALLRLGRTMEGALEAYRLPELRPNSPNALVDAMSVAIGIGDLRQARVFVDRARPLIEINRDAVAPEVIAAVSNFHLHELWIAGRLEELQSELERISGPDAWFGDVFAAASFYFDLGQFKKAEAIIDRLPGPLRPKTIVFLYEYKDDRSFLNWTSLDQSAMVYYRSVRTDMPRQQRELLKGVLSRNLFFPLLRKILEFELMAVDGDREGARRKFKVLTSDPRDKASEEYQDGAVFLARIYEQAGEDDKALEVLASYDLGPEPLYWNSSAGGNWYRLRYERARFYRKTGHPKEALEIESGLLRNLRLADPDHPIVVRLREQQRRPLDVY